MLIFLQEIALQLFLWLLQLIDGLMEIFSAISGVATVNYHGQQVNIIEFVMGFDRRSNLLVYLHNRRRADVYFHDRRTCQKYGGK